MISRESLERFGAKTLTPPEPATSIGFDIEGYLAQHDFEVLRRKPWNSNPDGLIIELALCPFDANHKGGSAAFTWKDGKPGFRCQHEGCRGKAIRDVLTRYPMRSQERLPRSVEAKQDDGDGRPKLTQSQLLIECAAEAELFHTGEGASFASLPAGDHRENWPIRSEGFRLWLVRAFYLKFAKPPGRQGLQDAMALLEARARFDAPEIDVFTRVAPYEDGICVDLCNEKWEAVIIRPGEWRIVSSSPVRFRRSRGMRPLPTPCRHGSVSKLRQLLNVGDDRNWILLLSWLLSAFRPKGPYPVLILQGEQGSAKSTTARLLRRIIDPSSALLRTPPRDERDLVIAANNSWVVAYDNVSGLSPWLSDALCRLATGGGFSTRELYSDTNEVIIEVKRPVMLNGIDHLPERPDLAERSIILNLPRIPATVRRDEAQLFAEYDEELPKILGAVFDAVSLALTRLQEVHLSRKPRMADFALWATAGEEGFGFKRGSFLAAFDGNRMEAVQETLESDIVAPLIIALMTRREGIAEPWKGTAGELLKALEDQVGDGVKRSLAWPKTPRAFSGHLRRIATFLREYGIEVDFARVRGNGGQRLITLTRTTGHLTVPTATIVPERPSTSAEQQ